MQCLASCSNLLSQPYRYVSRRINSRNVAYRGSARKASMMSVWANKEFYMSWLCRSIGFYLPEFVVAERMRPSPRHETCLYLSA